MDLPVWVLRSRLQPIAAGEAAGDSAIAATSETHARLERLQADLDEAPRSVPGRSAANNPSRSQARAPELGQLPAVLHYCWLGPYAYLGPAYTEPAARRFLRDLLVAAAGAPGKPAQLAFDAAELARQVSVEEVKRGLQAFVSKRLGAEDARLLLLDERLVSELPGVEQEGYRVSAAVRVALLPVADMRVLQDDGAAKAQLWQGLLALRPL